MRIGCTLPTFRDDPDTFLALARKAEDAGLDGVFAFEHIWPMRQPGRPSIAGKLALAAAAAVTSRVAIGTLVARIGLLPDATLLSELAGLQLVSGGRLIAGLGPGDRMSDDENEAYGVPVLPPAVRRSSLDALTGQLRALGVEVWIGGGSERTNEIAIRHGAVLNLWDVPLDALREAARSVTVTWGGPLPTEPGEAAERIAEIASAGAMFLVWAWPKSIGLVVEAWRRSGVGPN